MAARPRIAFVDFLPGPGDATAGFALEAMRRAAASPNAAHNDAVTTTVTHLESPSVFIAWRLRMHEIGIHLPFKPFYEEIGRPDPRAPKAAVDFVLWRYDGTQAHPALDPGDAQVVRALASVATTRFHLPTWADKAGVVAQSVGADQRDDVLAAMLYPPSAPEHIHPLDWVPRMQLAACLVLAWRPDGLRTLRSIALGPVDWIVENAVLALSEMALRNPSARADIEPIFALLRAQVPTEGYCCYAYALASAWLRFVPHHDPRYPALRQWHHDLRVGAVGGSTRSSGVIGLIDGINMEDYAEFCVRQDLQPGQSVAALAQEYGLPVLSPTHTYSRGWAEALNEDPRAQLAFEQTKSRIRLAMQGIDPDSDEARFSHNIMQGKGLDHTQEVAKAQAAQQQIARGDAGVSDPVVFPGQPISRLSDYVAMMKRMQGGDFSGTLTAYGLTMASYMQVAQAWGAKLGTDATLTAKMSAMMAQS